MLKAKKAMFTIAYLNHLFAGCNQIADPVKLLQQAVMEEYAGQLKTEGGKVQIEKTEQESEYGEVLRGIDL